MPRYGQYGWGGGLAAGISHAGSSIADGIKEYYEKKRKAQERKQDQERHERERLEDRQDKRRDTLEKRDYDKGRDEEKDKREREREKEKRQFELDKDNADKGYDPKPSQEKEERPGAASLDREGATRPDVGGGAAPGGAAPGGAAPGGAAPGGGGTGPNAVAGAAGGVGAPALGGGGGGGSKAPSLTGGGGNPNEHRGPNELAAPTQEYSSPPNQLEKLSHDYTASSDASAPADPAEPRPAFKLSKESQGQTSGPSLLPPSQQERAPSATDLIGTDANPGPNYFAKANAAGEATQSQASRMSQYSRPDFAKLLGDPSASQGAPLPVASGGQPMPPPQPVQRGRMQQGTGQGYMDMSGELADVTEQPGMEYLGQANTQAAPQAAVQPQTASFDPQKNSLAQQVIQQGGPTREQLQRIIAMTNGMQQPAQGTGPGLGQPAAPQPVALASSTGAGAANLVAPAAPPSQTRATPGSPYQQDYVDPRKPGVDSLRGAMGLRGEIGRGQRFTRGQEQAAGRIFGAVQDESKAQEKEATSYNSMIEKQQILVENMKQTEENLFSHAAAGEQLQSLVDQQLIDADGKEMNAHVASGKRLADSMKDMELKYKQANEKMTKLYDRGQVGYEKQKHTGGEDDQFVPPTGREGAQQQNLGALVAYYNLDPQKLADNPDLAKKLKQGKLTTEEMDWLGFEAIPGARHLGLGGQRGFVEPVGKEYTTRRPRPINAR